jgi:hypothetical protein
LAISIFNHEENYEGTKNPKKQIRFMSLLRLPPTVIANRIPAEKKAVKQS